LSVESIRDQQTNAVMINPFAAAWASQPPALPEQTTKTANSVSSGTSGVYFDATQKLALATLLALREQTKGTSTPTSTPGSTGGPAQLQVQTKSTSHNYNATFTHLPTSSLSVNDQLTLSSFNTIPQFQTFMSQMFETLKTINQTPTSAQTINSLNKNSSTGLTKLYNNYYRDGLDQTSYDLLQSKLNYLAQQTQKAMALPSPSVKPQPDITPGQKNPDFSKNTPNTPNTLGPYNDNLVTNPHIQKLNESFNSLVASLQGNVGASSLASFVQNLQHQAHAMSASGNVVNTSA
jgi:hypothetical protein